MIIKRKVHKFDTQTLRLELYRLLCYFMTSEHIADKESLSPLIDDFQDDQIVITLITIASTVRFIDDSNGRYLTRYKGKTKFGTKIDSQGKKHNLDIRDACNKILHAEEIKFEIFNKQNFRKIKPKINLYGKELDGSRYRAKIDILNFVDIIDGFVFFL
jgi:hypothetical protein